MSDRPSLIEYSGIRDGRDYTRGFVSAIHKWLPSQDSLLQQKSGGDLELYEVVATDDQVKSCLQQRFRALLSKDWEVIAGGDKRIDKQAAEHLEKQLEAINWDDCNEKMLWGIHYGYSAAEVLYARDGDKVVIADIKVRNRRRFHFNEEQKLVLKTMQNPLGEDLPERKFWHFCTGADHDDEPYGRGLGHWLYWPTFFKRNGVRWWMKFVEKYAQPTRLGKYPAGATQSEKDTLWNALGSFGDDARSMIPEGLEMEFLESSRAGTVDYKALCDQMDGAISKIILSQTMTTDDGSSKSQAEVHEGVKDEVIESDSDLLCESFNNSVAVWLTDWNYPGAAYPKVRRKIQADPDPATMAETDTKLQGLGISLKPEAITAKYGEDYIINESPIETPQLSEGQINSLITMVSTAKAGGWTPELLGGLINTALPNLPDEAVMAITKNLGDATGGKGQVPGQLSTPNPQTPEQSAKSLDDVAAQFAAPAKKKNCKTGISCGNACISALKTCKKPLTDEQKEMKPPIVASAGVEVKAAKAKVPATLESNLLAMANGEDPEGFEVSESDSDRAAKKFLVKNKKKTDKMKKEAEKLSDLEANALATWISDKYAPMNAVLYGGKIEDGVDRQSVETSVLLAAKALHKLPPATISQITIEAKKKKEPFKSSMPLGRYINIENPEAFVRKYQDALAGDGIIRESILFATSHIARDKFGFCDGDTNVAYEVKPKLDGSGSGRYVDHFKVSASEGEILYPPQTKFKVVGVIPPKPKSEEQKQFEQEMEAAGEFYPINNAKYAAIKFTGKATGKAFQSKFAQIYEQETGKKLSNDKQINYLEELAKAVDKKQSLGYGYDLSMGKWSGRNRDNNYIIQLEEV